MHIESKKSQIQIVKSLARFNTQLRGKESLTLLIAIKDKSFWLTFLLLLVLLNYLFAFLR